MKKKEKGSVFTTFQVATIAILTAVFSFIMGLFIANSTSNEEIYSSEITNFINSYMKLKEDYYEDINDSEALEVALEAIVNSLDPYTTVVDDSLSNMLQTKLEGQYKGLGIEIYNDLEGNIIVYNVIDNTPAKKAGILQNDIITKLNEQELKGITTTEFINMVKKEEDNTINLTIIRNNEEKKISLKREKVVLPSVTKDIYNIDGKKIGYIYLEVFALNTYEQFLNSLNELEKENIDSLIIDLRDNTGGHLASAEQLTSTFLDKTHVIYQIQTKQETTKYYSTSEKGKTYPVAILVNENSASASEIFAIAMQEEYKAIIVGKNTFGKGTVQEVNSLNENVEYKVTTKKWLSPKGNWINEVGVKPDIDVDLKDNKDTQKEAAINALLK